MNSYWKKVKLGEIIILKNGRTRPPNGKNFPVYGGNGILGYSEISNENNLVVVGRVGAYCGATYYEKDALWLSDNAIGITNNEHSDIKFLYYFLTSINLNKMAIGGAQPLLTQGILKEIDIYLPPLPVQRQIAQILSSLDDKIELLREENKTLEALAQTLFKRWFVDFEFPDANGNPYKSSGGKMIESELGLIPEGWKVGTLSDLANHRTNSISPSKFPQKVFRHYSIPSFDEDQKPVDQMGKFILSNKYVVAKNCFLVSKLNPKFPRIWTIINPVDFSICSTEFQIIETPNKMHFEYIYSILNSTEFTRELSSKAKGTSSSHQRANPKDIFDYNISIPDERVIAFYHNSITPLIEKINCNKDHSCDLISLRTLLLPKLMKGEIKV